jgi:hypothetical protein
MGKREGNGASQAACGASDQGDLAGEVKTGKFCHRASFVPLATVLARRSEQGEERGRSWLTICPPISASADSKRVTRLSFGSADSKRG